MYSLKPLLQLNTNLLTMTTPSKPIRDSHVAILAFPFGTHAAPLLAVIRRLALASPSTVFSFFNIKQSNSSLFTSPNYPENIRVYDVSDGVPEGYVLTGNPQEVIKLFVDAAPENFKREITAAEKEIGLKVTCVLTDAFFWFVDDLATEMNVKWVAFWTAGANSLTAHLYTDLIRDTINVTDTKMEETLGFITGMEKIRVKDLPEGIVFGDLNSVFSKMLHKMSLALPQATAVFINSYQELDPTFTNNLKSKFKHYFNIGPLGLLSSRSDETLVHDPHGCLAWLDKQSPGSVAYISFGTVMIPPLEEIVAIAEGLESSGVSFVWSIKTMVNLPKGFLDRTKEQGLVVPWAPQAELLKHKATGVFVTHCGWNSVLESVSGGVPMICRPFFGDQRLNGRAVEVLWEIGVMISNGVFTKDGFEKCLDRVLRQDDGKKMKGNAKKLKEQAYEAVSDKGSSSENFRNLLDVVVNI